MQRSALYGAEHAISISEMANRRQLSVVIEGAPAKLALGDLRSDVAGQP